VTGYLLAVLGFVGTFVMAAIGGMVSEEVRDRLGHVPHAILRLAACWLDPVHRVTVYEDEWLPELTHILKGDEARPITRLIHGTRFALGILATARRIACRLQRPVPALPSWIGMEGPERHISLVAARQEVDWRAHEVRAALDAITLGKSDQELAMAKERFGKTIVALEALLDDLDVRRGMLSRLIGDVQIDVKVDPWLLWRSPGRRAHRRAR
jgi:hypothetical protein